MPGRRTGSSARRPATPCGGCRSRPAWCRTATPTLACWKPCASARSSDRQHRRARQRLVDGARRLAAFANGPDDERLAAAYVAGDIHLLARGAIILVVGADVPA